MAKSNRGPLALAAVLGLAAIALAAGWLVGRDAAPGDRASDANRARQAEAQRADDARRASEAAAAAEAARRAAADAEAKAEARAEEALVRSASDGSALRIAPHGRLTLRHETLPVDGPLELSLDLPDDARGDGDHTVRLVSETGRRVDLLASPLPGAGSGVRLEIDPAVLEPGRYLIEIDTVERHPLQIKRYVLEVR